MTNSVEHSALVEAVARRILAEMNDHGGLSEFMEKLAKFPEQYIEDLALAAIDAVALSGCLHPRVTY